MAFIIRSCKSWSVGQYILCSLLALSIAHPAGAVMKPETSMIMINEEAEGGSLNVTNTADYEALLYVKVYSLPDDPQPQLLVTQPVTRLAAGQTQRLRFLLHSRGPLKTEHMKRVILEGIPLQALSGKNTVGLSLRQDLPIIIHPAGLPMKSDPWEALKFSETSGVLTIANPSRYVVRLSQAVVLLPSMNNIMLSKSYILPGETLTVKGQDAAALKNSKQIQIQSLSKYGYVAGLFIQPLEHQG